MKKAISLVVAIVMCLVLSACSTGDGLTSSEENVVIEYEEVITNSDGTQQTVQNQSNVTSDNEGQQEVVDNINSESDSNVSNNANNNTSNSQNNNSNNNVNGTLNSNINSTVDNNTTNDSNNNESNNSSNDTNNVSSNTNSGNEDWIDFENTVEVDICDPIIRAYIDATDPRNQYTYLSEYGHMELDHQVLPINWRMNGSEVYTVYISENADFSDSYICKFSGSKFDGGICIPGKTYYWKVLGNFSDEILGGGKMRIVDAPVRWLNIEGLHNVRDIGGWKTESGKTVKYGKIYRGGMLEDIKDKGIEKFKALGIKTDIDIRSTASWDSNGAVPKTGLNYFFFNTNQHYDYVLGFGKAEEEIRENYPKMFEVFADESNYPIYMHCNYGNDRTGSMMFILNGLVGVTYEDLTRDYELTSYAFSHDNRWRGNGTGGTFGPNDLIQNNISNSNVDGRWGMMNKAFMESKYCTDGKLSTAIENFLLDRGVKQEHIDAYKKIILE